MYGGKAGESGIVGHQTLLPSLKKRISKRRQEPPIHWSYSLIGLFISEKIWFGSPAKERSPANKLEASKEEKKQGMSYSAQAVAC